MKKILFASTALVAFGAAAQAEVLLTGNAEMGVFAGDGGVAQTDDDAEFFTDIDVTFTLTGETDGGIAFGANVDLDEGGDGSPASDDNRDDGGVVIFISGGFGTLTMGDTDGALDWALTEVNFSSGSINDDETEHAGFNGSSQDIDGRFDGQVLRYDYSFGDFGIAVSAELNDSSPFEEGETLDVIDDAGNVIGEVTVTDDIDEDDGDGDTYGIGIRYGLDLGGNTVNLGLGYQDIDGDDAIGVSVAGTIAGFAVGVSYIDYDDVDFERAGFDLTGVESHYGIGIGYDAGPISLSANYGEYDSDDDASGFGLSAGYDLGGGAIVQLGYGDSNFDGDDADDFETVSFGIRMNF